MIVMERIKSGGMEQSSEMEEGVKIKFRDVK